MPKLATASIIFFGLGIITCTWDYLLFVDAFGFTLKAHQGLFFISFLLAVAFHGKGSLLALHKTPVKGFGIAMAALGLYYLATAPWSFFPLKSFLYSGWIFFNLTTIWINAQLLRNHSFAQMVIVAVVIAALFQSSVVAIDHVAYQFGHTSGLIGFNQDEILSWGASRPHGFAMEPSYLATFLCFAILYIASFLSRSETPIKILLFPVLALLLFALVAAASRTGWFGLFFGGFIFILLECWRRKNLPWKPIILTTIVSAAIVGAYLASMPAHQRNKLDSSLVSAIYKGTDGSGFARLRAYKYAWEMAKETNFLGTGLGASFRYWTTTHPETYIGAHDPNSHGNEIIMSTWGQLLGEGGIPALLLYAMAALFLIRALWREWMATGETLILGALASALVWFAFAAFWLGNVARGDVWVWYAIWSCALFTNNEKKSSFQGSKKATTIE